MTGEDGGSISTRVLVESMVTDDGSIDVDELYVVAGHLGMTDQQIRLCVRRLVAEGQLIQEGRGRRAALHATGELRSSLAPNAEYIRLMFAQDRGEANWDGVWHLVGFAIPESARPARDGIRTAVVRLGGAAIQGGLYVSPHAWESHLADLLADLDVAEYVTMCTTNDLSVGGVSDPRRLASTLWPLESIAAGYRQLLDMAHEHRTRLRSIPRVIDPGTAHPAADPTTTTLALTLAAEFSRATEPDPLLPPELLPQPWPGTRARDVVVDCWSALLARYARPRQPLLFRSYAAVVDEVLAVHS